mmetsp:Transcript_14515/g.38410  ORF Transcript_14515/g.38410 Transcript_14515/m.38410 type:complete len:238 (+) Transcript_14515:466-1179(+)
MAVETAAARRRRSEFSSRAVSLAPPGASMSRDEFVGDRSTPTKAVRSVKDREAPFFSADFSKDTGEDRSRAPSFRSTQIASEGGFCRLFGDDCVVVGEASSRFVGDGRRFRLNLRASRSNLWAVSPRVRSSKSRAAAASKVSSRRKHLRSTGRFCSGAGGGWVNPRPWKVLLNISRADRSRFARGAANINRSDGSSSRLRLTRTRTAIGYSYCSVYNAYRFVSPLLYPTQRRDKRGA